MADDVTIRVGSTRGSNAGFTAARRDLAGLEAAAGDATDELRALDRLDVEPTIEVPVDELAGDLDRIAAQLRQLAGRDVEIPVTADAGQATGELGDVERLAQGLDGEKVEVKVDAQADTGKMDDAERKLKGLDGEKATMSVDVDEKGTGGKLEGLKGKLKGAATSLGQGVGQFVGSAITEAISSAVSGAVEKQEVQATLQAQFAGDPQAQTQSGKVAGALWAQGYGESLQEVNGAVFSVMTSSKQMRDASEQDVTAIAGQALNLSKVWGVDVTESMRSVGQLMNTQLVPDATSGLGLIDAAYRRLGPAADDTLDTVTEYSTQFRQLGLDGPTAFNMLAQAVDAGARDTDTAADALKEFTLIAQSMPDGATDGFTRLGLNARQMQKDINAGGTTATKALDTTLDRLRSVKDPANQAEIAVELFGTKAEDLQDSLLALDPTPVNNAFKETQGTFNEVNDTMNNTTASGITQMQRGLGGVVTSVGDVDGAVESAIPIIGGGLTVWNNLFGETETKVAAHSTSMSDILSGSMFQGVSKAIGSAQTLPGGVGNAIQGMFGKGRGAGTDLGTGFERGILDTVVRIANAARLAAQRAIDSVRNFLGAHSPARKTIDTGHDFGEGFEVGVNDWTGRIIDSARDLGSAATDALRLPGAPGAGLQVGGSAALAAPASAPAAAAGSVELVFSGNTDSAFATAFMNLVRTGKIQLRATT